MSTSAINQNNLPANYSDEIRNATLLLQGEPKDDTFQTIELAGDPDINERRTFHTLEHFHRISHAADVTLDENLPGLDETLRRNGLDSELIDIVRAVIMRAGAHHDIVYHVDEDYACGRTLRDPSVGVVPTAAVDRPSSDYAVSAPDATSEAGTIIKMAQILFDVHPKEKLTQFSGKNEYLSAVYAGLQGVQEKIPLKYVLAEMMMIEATRPFHGPKRMDALRGKFEAANRLLPGAMQLDSEEMNAFMMGASQLANIDVSDFARDFSTFFDGSIQLYHEAGHPMETVADYFDRAFKRESFNVHLKDKMEGGEAQIFHAVTLNMDAATSYPPPGVLDKMEASALRNVSKDLLAARALKMAAALCTATTVLQEEESVGEIMPRIQKERRGSSQMTGGFSKMDDTDMTETALVLREKAQHMPLLAVASYLLANLDKEVFSKLSERINKHYDAHYKQFGAAFETRRDAQELMGWIRDQPGMGEIEPMLCKAMGYSQQKEMGMG